MLPQFPIYVPSYSREKPRLTMKTLDNLGIPYYVVVEPEQLEQYLAVFDKSKVLVIPKKYHFEYDTFDDLGMKKSQGPGPARNFAWEHSMKNGFKWHWVMDDNIDGFFRLNKNEKVRIETPGFIRAMEDFVLRYKNIAMAGPHYYMFFPARVKIPPLIFNTRVYSCNLIRNDTPYRWRGRYNEDTDLSLRMLKDGWVTLQFTAFLQRKITTQVIAGGNTERFYSKEGTYPKSIMLKNMHPELTKVVWKFGRWHHHVDYSPFKNNKLIKKEGTPITDTPNNYGMKLVMAGNTKASRKTTKDTKTKS